MSDTRAKARRLFGRFKGDANFTRLFKNGSTLLGSNTIASILDFAQVAVLTRLLLPVRYGDFSLVLAAVSLVNQFLDVRVREMTVKFGSSFYSKGDRSSFAALIKLSYVIDAVVGGLSCLVVVAIAPWIAGHILHRPELSVPIELYALVLIVGTPKGTNNSLLLIAGKFSWISSYGVAMSAMELAAVGAAAFFFDQINAVLLALVFGEVVRLVVSTVLARKALVPQYRVRDVVRSKFSVLNAHKSEITRLLMHTNFMGYFRLVNTKLDLMLLGHFRPDSADVAVYKLARGLAVVVVRFSDPFFSAIFPDLSKLYAAGRYDEFKALINRCMATMATVMLAGGLFVTAISRFAPVWVSGEAYSAAGPLLAVGVWCFAIGGAFFWTWPAAVSVGRADFGTKVGVLVVIIQLGLAFLLVPKYGAMGNMIALLATSVVSQPLMAFLVFRQLSKVQARPLVVTAEPSSSAP